MTHTECKHTASCNKVPQGTVISSPWSWNKDKIIKAQLSDLTDGIHGNQAGETATIRRIAVRETGVVIKIIMKMIST